MKAFKFARVLVLIPFLGACAAQQSQNLPEPDLASKYIYAIEKDSENRATRIYWVNPPTNDMVERYIRKDSAGG